MDVSRRLRQPSSRVRRRAGSSRHGRRSCPTRASCRCCGRCFRITRICCRPISRTIPKAATLGASFVRKPLYSREGANVALVSAGANARSSSRPLWRGRIHPPGLAPLPNFSGQYPVLGSWLVDHTPCGLSIREDENPITGNTSRFVPHAILVGRISSASRCDGPQLRLRRRAPAWNRRARPA